MNLEQKLSEMIKNNFPEFTRRKCGWKEGEMKRIIVQTVYENCTDEFVKDYINGLCIHNEMLKEGKEDFLKGDTIGFRTEDPNSPCVGVTQYKLEEML